MHFGFFASQVDVEVSVLYGRLFRVRCSGNGWLFSAGGCNVSVFGGENREFWRLVSDIPTFVGGLTNVLGAVC